MLESKLNDRNIKPTTMRLLVLQELVQCETTLSLKELEARFERADTATLYRTLKTFEKKKLIHSITDGTGSTKYALCEEQCTCAPEDQHIHFHCDRCKTTYCLTQSRIPAIDIPSGFEAESVSMVYKGLCGNCS